MSRLIDQMRQTGFPDRSARDLTLEYGEWLEKGGRDDIFLSNPDFAQEYHALKDDISRARRPSYLDEFKGAFGSAVDDLQASGFALGALAAHGADKLGIPGASSARTKLLDLMREQEEEAAEFKPSVPSYSDISGEHLGEDIARYATYGFGTVAPSILQAGVSGLAGAAAGAALGTTVEPGGGTAVGAVGGALLGLAEKKLAQKVLSELLEKGAKNVTLAQVTRALPREAIEAEAKRLARSIGSQSALAASSIGQETGSIYGENPEAPGTALAFGAVAGLLDVIPEAYVLSRFFAPGEAVTDAASKGVKAYLKRFAIEAAKTVPMEGSTEAAQTLIEIAAAKYGRGESPTSFTDSDYQQALNAGIIGAIGGAGMAPISASANPKVRRDPYAGLSDSVLEGLPLQPSDEAGERFFAMDQNEALPDFGRTGLLSRDTLSAETVGALRAEEEVASEEFGFFDAAPYPGGFGGLPNRPGGPLTPESQGINEQIRKAGGASGATVGNEPAVKLPTGVEKAIEHAERAAAAWELSHASTPETGFGGEPVLPGESMDFGPDTAPPLPGELEHLRPQSEVIEDAGANRTTRTPREPSKVPLGDLFPSDLVPRQDLNPFIPQPPNQNAAQTRLLPQNGQLQYTQTPQGALPPQTGNRDLSPESGQGTQALITPPTQPPTSSTTSAAAPVSTEAAVPVAGVTNVVDNTPQGKQLSHDAQVALWKQKNKKAPKGRSFNLSPLPDGSLDLLNAIFEEGGVAPPGESKGGEFDSFYDAFSDTAKILIRKGGAKLVDLAQRLGYEYVPDFYRAVESAKRSRREVFRQSEKEQGDAVAAAQAGRFREAAIENKSRPKSQASRPVQASTMGVGDRFKVKREPIEVSDIDPDTGDLIVTDGPRFGTQRIGANESFYPDKRTIRRVPRSEATFLDEDDEASVEPAPAPAPPPAAPDSLLPGPTPFNLAGEQESEALPPPPSDETVPMFSPDEVRSTAPTPLDIANAAAREALASTLPPMKVVQPTGEQLARQSGNGVPPIPSDSIPNLRRLRVFETRAPAPAEESAGVLPPIARAKEPIEALAVDEAPSVHLAKMVGKLSKKQSTVAVIIVDNATGEAFMRHAYGGPSNTVNVDMTSSRKGTAVGQGSTTSAEADFLNGTEGRPIQKILAEQAPNGQRRYSIYGVAELTSATGPANYNMGQAAALNTNPAIQEAARRYWNEQAKNRPALQSKMPEAKTDLERFPEEMAAWRRENPGEAAAESMLTRIRAFAAVQSAGVKLSDRQLEAWAEKIREAIEEMARVQQRQSILLSADYTVAPQHTTDVMFSALRALTEGREVDVAAFEQQLGAALDSAAKTTGMVLTPAGKKKILAFGVASLDGPISADTVISVLHETGHVVTDGLPEPLRVAFHEAINQLPFQQSRWLMNPRSLDIRLLANADPSQLSPEQRKAFERLTPSEVAAARRMDRAVLAEEQAAEHLAQLGWDKSEAKGMVQAALRFLKELWFRLAMAVQKAVKGEEHVSPALVRRYVENRFLQFIHRDSALAGDRITDLLTWIGAPATDRQLIPVFPTGNDWETRMQFIDPATGQLIPVSHGIHTPESQLAYLNEAIDNATRFVAANPAGGADTSATRLTKRVAMSAPLSFTPSIQTNTTFAAINLEEEIYNQIAAHTDIAPFLPPSGDFHADWLKLPDKQTPASRRTDAETWAKEMKDPTTGSTVAYDVAQTVDGLPSIEEEIVDKEGNPIKLQLTEAQDAALECTMAALGDTQARVQRRINHETDRISDLERMRKRNPAEFPDAAVKELDELNESLPLRKKIHEQLTVQKNALLSKFQPSDLVSIYPTAPYLTVPSPDATEKQIRAAKKGVVPRDLKFTDKTTFAGHLSAMEAWLLNADNKTKGQIYGVISEQYRKLNQIATDLNRAATAGVLRRAITGSFVDELRASGLRALQNLGKKFFEVSKIINEHSADLKTAGSDWSEKFAKFAESLGERPDQSFKERVYDEIMRVWNFIDVSERGKIGTADEGNLFDRIEGAMRTRTGLDVKTPTQRAALRAFLMSTIENERQIRIVYEKYPALKVYDATMGVYRRLITHGLVTGRRSVARHMSGLFFQMQPAWSDTIGVSPSDPRTFWEAAGDLFTSDRKAFDARTAELFPGYVIRDFVEPIVNNNTQVFDVADTDGVVRKASLLRVRQAWSTADDDVTKFALNLHNLEGGKPGEESRTVASVMASFNRMFNEIKSDHDKKQGVEKAGTEILPRQMMDARVANDWPAEWVSYATYAEADNLQLLHQLGLGAAFGPDAISGSGELASTIREANQDLDDLHYRYDEDSRNGMSQRDIEAKMGKDDFGIAKNALKIKANLDRVDTAFRTMSASTNYLAGDFKLFNDMLGFAATMMVQNPRGTLINTSDILGALVALKLSTPALKALKRQILTLAADLGNGVLQAFGQNAAFNVDLSKKRRKANVKDSDIRTTWRTKLANYGPGQSLAAPSGYESQGAKTKRVLTRFAVLGRDIIPNLGSPLQGTSEMQSLSPKLRWGGFPNWAMSTMNANIDAANEVFEDLAIRGVERINAMPAADRAAYVRELELGVRDMTAEELGYFGGIILNDKAAFDSLKFALQTKMAGEKGVGQFVAKAYRRQEAAGGAAWEAISNSQFVDIINYANTEWTLQGNFASLPPWMQSGPLRPLFVFLTWPYNAMRRFGKSFTDPEGRLVWWGANSTVADGMKAFFLLAAPATVAGSFAIDWYDKYLLGKRQNLRETSWTTAIPVVGAFTDPAAFVERVGRYGSAGLASDIINQIVNFDTQRNLSLDSRIVAINALSSLVNSLVTTPLHQKGNITYASVGRPFFQAIGGGGVLQYLQVMNNALGLNTQDAAINSRINTGNYLKAAGREMGLPIRVSRGPSELPSPTTPYTQQMELAALVNNPELFKEAYRNAVEAAREERKEPGAAEKYVAENFIERHPLRRNFRVSPTEAEYRKLLASMDEYGAGQVRASINSYNRYLTNWFGKKPFYGKSVKDTNSAEGLIRSADRINASFLPPPVEDSLLAIP